MPSRSRRSGSRRSRRTLERELGREFSRRIRQTNPRQLVEMGIARHVSPRNSRAPIGTPSGIIITQPTILQRTRRRRGRSHNRDLRRVGEILDQRDFARRHRIANSRPVRYSNNFTNPVEAEPFARSVELAQFANNGSANAVAYPLQPSDVGREGVNEYEFYSQYQMHGPEQHRARRLYRLNRNDMKNRNTSPDMPIRSTLSH